MKKDVFLDEIIEFCFDYGVIIDENIKSRIEYQLNEPAFIENLISVITKKSKTDENVDIERVKELLIELEKIRLELEYKNSIKNTNTKERTKIF